MNVGSADTASRRRGAAGMAPVGRSRLPRFSCRGRKAEVRCSLDRANSQGPNWTWGYSASWTRLGHIAKKNDPFYFCVNVSCLAFLGLGFSEKIMAWFDGLTPGTP